MLKSSQYGLTTWLDHAPLSMTLASPLARPTQRSCRLNESILTAPAILSTTKTLLVDYFTDNSTPNVSDLTVWEAHKCGHLIKLASAATKVLSAKFTELRSKISLLERSHKASLQGEDLQCLLLLHCDLASLLHQQVQRQEFVTYYSSLYNLILTPTNAVLAERKKAKISTYLRSHLKLKLTADDSALLERPISLQELKPALQHAKSEPFMEAVRQDHDIRGLTVNGVQNKILGFADDLNTDYMENTSVLEHPKRKSKVTAIIAEEMETTIPVMRNNNRNQKQSLISGSLSSEVIGIIANLTGCIPQNLSPLCRNNCLALKYRHITGACNNRNHPAWGASNTLLTRWLSSQYEDGINEPKGWNPHFLYNSFQLPQVREVTKKIIHASNKAFTEDDLYSHIIIEWGQYIDHDIAFTPQSLTKVPLMWGVDCKSTCENLYPCYPIKVSANDPLSQGGCIPFFRSSAACGTGNQNIMFGNPSAAKPREQINGLTSFIDASTVYGSTSALEHKLKNVSSDEGLLQVNLKYSDHGRAYMPFVPDVPSPCIQDPASGNSERIECFLAGESRSNEVISLAAIHTLWLREHNRLAKALKKLNPHWSSEMTYQEARKIVGAFHQIITIRDYIPKVLGQLAFDQYIGTYKGYDEKMNPSISNIFSTAAFRFGHATIPPIVHRLNSQYRDHPQYPSLLLNEVFFRPWRIVKEGGLDPLIRGMLGKSAKLQTQQEMISEELTEKLIVLSNNGSVDLASLNLQRGRDHGLPGYNDWREFCGLSRLNTTTDLALVISDKNLIKEIIDLYGHPDNIDVWLGGLAEDFLPGARTGPLIACLIGRQMKALREGDWFWYENKNIFTNIQRAELAKHSLSRVICDNTGLTHVPLDAFLMTTYPDNYVSCDILPGINLEAWKDSLDKGSSCSHPRKIENGDFVFCSETVVIYSCHTGYHLQGQEELTCQGNEWSDQVPYCSDINECDDQLNPPCHASAKCKNTLGGFRCLCMDPYELSEDKRTCVDSGRLPMGSLASIVLVAILFVSWASMYWILVCRG
ncbi:thyroid peroxidase [Rhinophrynus dorsalis]